MPVEKPFTYQNILDRWADGLKVLGAGNGAGLLTSAASFQFFAGKADILGEVKTAAVLFLIGTLLFAIALFILTILPLAIEQVVLVSQVEFESFKQLLVAVGKSKENSKPYIIFLAASIFSFVFFMIGLLQALQVLIKI